MSVFRKHKSIVDRAASDRVRHKKKIEKAIKESIKDVIAEESIIGQNGKKKIRIPVKGIKEYRFIFGNLAGYDPTKRLNPKGLSGNFFNIP